MSKKKPQASNATEPIKLETVYPIHIREKDGGLSFAAPGETIAFETNETVKIAMLAHKMNEIIIQMHRMQRVVFANNKILAEQLRQSNGNQENTDTK